jgi:DNA-binding MarR family transcriptional regulator
MTIATPVPMGFLLRMAAGAHRRAIDDALAPLKVTAPQFFVLTLLANEPGISTADLARRTGHRMPTLSAIVANLKRRELVESQPHSTHGRILQLSLTQFGVDLHQQCHHSAQRVEETLVALADQQANFIHAWLQQVADC